MFAPIRWPLTIFLHTLDWPMTYRLSLPVSLSVLGIQAKVNQAHR
jgi:hypothetical protein